MKSIKIIIIALIILTIIAGIIVYPSYPDKVASHWNEKGEVNGYMSKFLGLALMPIIMIFCFLLFLFLPKIDPMKKNIKNFEKYYDLTIFFIILFLLYTHILTMIYNLGLTFNMSYAVVIGIAILFFFIGLMLPKCKRNWFMGIRNPWTLSSDKVWEKTHNLAGLIFKIFAVLFLLTLIIPNYSITIFVVLLLLMVVWIFVYSYLEYKKEKK
jgi:uncharacterized membrane protein